MDPSVSIQLLEYDKRFEQYGSDYTFYDYNHPEELPSELKHSFRVVVADPPYLVRITLAALNWYHDHLCLLLPLLSIVYILQRTMNDFSDGGLVDFHVFSFDNCFCAPSVQVVVV